ncbi:sulfatase-like hydrolase/transferase [Sulfuriroseicoccus oceanibius]|uniref:Sulfatase-like hydrolase/transferase n=1 Tax=Sulfuriroseicoccus oceanibius TaxID=2707525 RepID=A0A6B3L8T6_9BACT|nr:sulfatase-like hydrolase/transferase [Sulfuriroseicoccus oceanibius]QQL46198.1 sulfatase-like hydrolase/transferase [Sulfuriroseicoccus oceanibius]
MKIPPWLTVLAGMTLVLFEVRAEQPNIVLLLADDLGYGELGCYGQQVIQTPTLDKLAAEGMRFEQFYAGSPVCAPSRAVLMSGKHAGHTSIRGNLGVFDGGERRRVALQPDETTMAEMLKAAGYQTAFVGKWHLDVAEDPSTWAFSRGFDFSVQEQWDARNPSRYNANKHWINGDQESINYDITRYDCLDEFRTDLALQFLDEKDDERPFFLMMSYRAPHAHERKIGNQTLYADRGWTEMQRRHAAKITLLDREVGRLLKRLEKDGDLENTLVLFTSDNGPHVEGQHIPNPFQSSGPFRGHKRDVYEGGIRVPLIAYWNGKIQAGSVTRHLSAFYDIMPTLAQVAGTSAPDDTDGISFLPELQGKAQAEHEALYFELFHVGNSHFRQAVRQQNLKAVRNGENSEIELYDLSTNHVESQNLAPHRPQEVEMIKQQIDKSHRDTPGFSIQK